MKPLKPIGSKAGIALGVAFFLLFFLVWSVVTLGGFVSKTFLADPFTMLQDGIELVTRHGFGFDIAPDFDHLLALQQAGKSPQAVKSKQPWHLRMTGDVDSHSYLGTSKGQATMQ